MIVYFNPNDLNEVVYAIYIKEIYPNYQFKLKTKDVVEEDDNIIIAPIDPKLKHHYYMNDFDLNEVKSLDSESIYNVLQIEILGKKNLWVLMINILNVDIEEDLDLYLKNVIDVIKSKNKVGIKYHSILLRINHEAYWTNVLLPGYNFDFSEINKRQSNEDFIIIKKNNKIFIQSMHNKFDMIDTFNSTYKYHYYGELIDVKFYENPIINRFLNPITIELSIQGNVVDAGIVNSINLPLELWDEIYARKMIDIFKKKLKKFAIFIIDQPSKYIFIFNNFYQKINNSDKLIFLTEKNQMLSISKSKPLNEILILLKLRQLDQ